MVECIALGSDQKGHTAIIGIGGAAGLASIIVVVIVFVIVFIKVKKYCAVRGK